MTRKWIKELVFYAYDTNDNMISWSQCETEDVICAHDIIHD